MVGIDPAVMAELQATTNSYMPNTVTNNRTGAVLPCRVSFETAQIARLEGVPFWMHTPKWRLTVPLIWNGVPVDVQVGDRLTEPSIGTYALIETEQPDSYTIAINTWGARIHPTGGVIIIPNATLTFRTTRNGVTDTLTVSGRIQPLSLSAKVELLGPDSTTQPYEILWDSSFHYPVLGGTPHGGDMVHAPAIAADWLPMHEPTLFLDVLPYSSALVEIVE